MSAPSLDALVARAGLPRREARALLAHAAGRPREWLIAHGDEPAAAGLADRFAGLVQRRLDGEPLAYLLGEREFRGLRFAVDRAVLVPRPETELLVDQAIARAAPGARVIDLGTGSGAIAVALAHARPDLRVTATERSRAALALARRNARTLLAAGEDAIDWREGDWWAAVGPEERFALALANPPYLAPDDAHLDGELRFEPREALVAERQGLADLHRLGAGAVSHLEAGGWLLLEHGWQQGPAVRALLLAAGLCKVVTLHDDQGRERVSLGCLPRLEEAAPHGALSSCPGEALRTQDARDVLS